MVHINSKFKNILVTTGFLFSLTYVTRAEDTSIEQATIVNEMNEKYKISYSQETSLSEALDEISQGSKKNPLFLPLTFIAGAASNLAEKIEDIEEAEDTLLTKRKKEKILLKIPLVSEELYPELIKSRDDKEKIGYEAKIGYTMPIEDVIPTAVKILNPFYHLSKIGKKEEK